MAMRNMSLGRTSTIYRLYDVAAVQDWFGHQEANILWENAGFHNNDESIKRELNAAYTKFCERFFFSLNNTTILICFRTGIVQI